MFPTASLYAKHPQGYATHHYRPLTALIMSIIEHSTDGRMEATCPGLFMLPLRSNDPRHPTMLEHAYLDSMMIPVLGFVGCALAIWFSGTHLTRQAPSGPP